MSKSMFEKEVDVKLEKTENSYVACRALSQRARDINVENQQQEVEPDLAPSVNPTAVALADYSNGRIAFSTADPEDAEEDKDES